MLKSKLYNFLIAPKYRIWRHVLLVSIFTLLSCRRIFFIYRNDESILGYNIYILCFITLIVYLSSVYVNLYFLVPRLLLKKKYGLYLSGLFLVVLTPLVYQIGQEYFVRTMMDLPHKVVSYFSPTIVAANLSSFMTILICTLGTSIPQIFKVRVEENQRINRMEQENIKSELDRLKEQLSPGFLSNILNRTSVLVKTDPQKASDMLMKLGQLLRYQLYDCNRENVLFSAEIKFIRGYLDLERMYNNRFEYEMTISNKANNLFLPPLLFIPFVQHTISSIEDSGESASLRISFIIGENNLSFVCQSTINVHLSKIELFAVNKRLSLLYPNSHQLSISRNQIELQLKNVSDL